MGNNKTTITRRPKRVSVGELVIVTDEAQVTVFPDPVIAVESFVEENGAIGIVLELGNSKLGTYEGECRVLFDDGYIGWIPTIYLLKVER